MIPNFARADMLNPHLSRLTAEKSVFNFFKDNRRLGLSALAQFGVSFGNMVKNTNMAVNMRVNIVNIFYIAL